jgi:hypothetical protein
VSSEDLKVLFGEPAYIPDKNKVLPRTVVCVVGFLGGLAMITHGGDFRGLIVIGGSFVYAWASLPGLDIILTNVSQQITQARENATARYLDSYSERELRIQSGPPSTIVGADEQVLRRLPR